VPESKIAIPGDEPPVKAISAPLLSVPPMYNMGIVNSTAVLSGNGGTRSIVTRFPQNFSVSIPPNSTKPVTPKRIPSIHRLYVWDAMKP
jgi:hypothetical protein